MGMRHKMRLGRWAKPSMHALRAARRVRGTKADVFGHAEVRKIERAMIPEYIAAVDNLLARLADTDIDELVAIAELPDQVRGYEDLKLRRAEAYRVELQRRLTTLRR
jgi:indolepyruvate ferredoxin oxidoreductase